MNGYLEHNSAHTISFLLRRTSIRSIRTKHTAISHFWLKNSLAILALIKKLPGIDRHGFYLLVATLRARNGRCQNYFHFTAQFFL